MNTMKMSILALSLGTLALTGCATNESMVQKDSAEAARYKAQLAQEQARNAQLQQQLAAQQATMNTSTGNVLFPPNPQPGHCYARVLIPATFETNSQQVLVRPAGEDVDVIPATYDWAEQQVLDKAASKKIVVVPATYKTASERVMVKPASSRLVTTPAEYKTVTEKVLDVPAHTEWKRGDSTIPGAIKTSIDKGTGEIMCLVNVPATYKTIEKTVLVSPASVQEIPIPAEYKTITKTVVATPATTKEVVIPATYKTVRVQTVVTPPQTRTTAIPAEYKTVSSRQKVTDEAMKWREVVCETNMTPTLAHAIQTKLRSAGYYKGPIDSLFGRMTMTASQRYSVANDLPVGRDYITLDMLKSLNITL